MDTQAQLSEILNILKKQQEYPGDEITLDSFMQSWFIGMKSSIMPNTYNKYHYLYRLHLKPYFGGHPLTKIDIDMIQELVALKANQLASSVVREIFSCVLKQAMRSAEGRKLIPSNPCTFVKLPQVKQDHGRAMTDEEICRMMETSRKSWSWIAFPILIYTGMRRGELLALEWSDINFEKNEIRINKSWVREKGKSGGTLNDPKAQSFRVIKVPEALMNLLRRCRVNEGKGRTYVVSQLRSDKRVSPSNFEKMFNRWKKKAGISKEVHIHTTRHTYCTLGQEAGADAFDLIQQTGHSDPRMLYKVYFHARTSEAQEKVSDRIGDRLESILSA